MARIVVVDDDETFLRAVERELRREGIDVQATSSPAGALALLREQHSDVLLTDLRMHEIDGLALLDQARRIAPRTRAVVMSGSASAHDYESALSVGAVRVLLKPFDTEHLLEAVRQAADCEHGFRGRLHGFGLVDLLQLLHYARRAVVVEVSAAERGALYLEAGELVHAEYGARRGEPALSALLALPDGAVETAAFVAPRERTITRGFEELLLDSLRVLDEQGAPPEPEPAPEQRRDPSPSARFSACFPELVEDAGLVAVGVRLSDESATQLRGALLAQDAGPAICALARAAERLTGSESGLLERHGVESLAYVVWDAAGDVAFLLSQQVRTTSQAVWLRTLAQTFARRLQGAERAPTRNQPER